MPRAPNSLNTQMMTIRVPVGTLLSLWWWLSSSSFLFSGSVVAAAAFVPVRRSTGHPPPPTAATTRSSVCVATTAPIPSRRKSRHHRPSITTLHLFRRIRRRFRDDGGGATTGKNVQEDDDEESLMMTTADDDTRDDDEEIVDICIIGGGVSGLTAALEVLGDDDDTTSDPTSVTILESDATTAGGRVRSDASHDDGRRLVLDRGFAVFVEAYPTSRRVLDYEALDLRPFAPGALIRRRNRNQGDWARVSDPLRAPGDLWKVLTSPVGHWQDKLRVIPLIWHVRTSSIERLFGEPETATAACLRDRWGFSAAFCEEFFAPFLEGIYLTTLDEQSSRMFHLIMKMFGEGSASLPADGGMGAVSRQLTDRVHDAGAAVIHTNRTVTGLSSRRSDDDATVSYDVETADGRRLRARCVVVATEEPAARTLLSPLMPDDFDGDPTTTTPQRSVGCVYYSFPGPPPVREPLLILNGIASERDTRDHPVNNLCFPTTVQPSYAPDGTSLCSVTVLSTALAAYEDDDAGLDHAVRRQLADWFSAGTENDDVDESLEHAILHEWRLERIYRIDRAQPGQLYGSFPASVHGGRPSHVYRGRELPSNVFVCGDHMATATLNGALESGRRAGQEAARAVLQRRTVDHPTKPTSH